MVSRRKARITIAARMSAVFLTFLFSGWALSAPNRDVQKLDSLVAEGKFEQARTTARDLMKLSGNRADLRLWWANFLRRNGQTEMAIREYEAAARLDPRSAAPLVSLAQISLQNLDLPKTFQHANKALTIDPASSEARAVLTNALIQSGRHEDASKELQTLLKNDGENSNVLWLAYQLELKKGNFEAARKYLKQVSSKDPSSAQWQLEMSELLQSMGEAKSARQHLRNVVSLEPNSIRARLQLARNLEVFDHDYDAAIEQYVTVLKSDPDSAEALSGIERCRIKKNDLALRLKLVLYQLMGWNKPR